MAIPSQKERPDLCDGYDGLPEGHQSSVESSPRLQAMMSSRNEGRETTPTEKDRESQENQTV